MNNQAAQTMPANIVERLASAKDKLPTGSDERKAVWQAIEYFRAAALSQTAGVAEGCVVVPREPTPEMMSAFRSAPIDLEDVLYRERLIAGVEPDVTNVKQVGPAIEARHFRKSYAAMLAAAPAASGGEGAFDVLDKIANHPVIRQCETAAAGLLFDSGYKWDGGKWVAPQPPSAASVSERARELVQSWRFMSDPYHGKCADELESLLAGGA